MKVCFLNHTLDESGGAGKFCRSLLEALQRLEPRLEYVVLTSEASGAPDELPLVFPSKRRLTVALPRIRDVMRRYEVLHALDGYPFGVVAALASLGLPSKLMITAIGTGALEPLSRPIAGRLLRWAYRRAAAVTAISRNTQSELLKAMPDLKIEVINHGVDAKEFAEAPEVSEAEKLEIKKLKPYVLSVGALKPRKGFSYSLRAFAGIGESFPELRYVIVGGGERDRVEAEILQLRLSGRVTIFDQVPREFLRVLYRNAEFFILLPVAEAGDVEGFGLVFLEAAASGLPVIGTLESGAADAVADGRNGFLVPPRDSRAAAEAMRRILSDAGLRQKFVRGSLEWAALMSWERAAQEYLNIYQRLI